MRPVAILRGIVSVAPWLITGAPRHSTRVSIHFFRLWFCPSNSGLEMAYPRGPLSVPEKETESQVRVDNEEAILLATRLSKDRIRFRMTMPKSALVQDGFVDFARTSALPNTFALDGWKDRSLRIYRTVGEAREAGSP